MARHKFYGVAITPAAPFSSPFQFLVDLLESGRVLLEDLQHLGIEMTGHRSAVADGNDFIRRLMIKSRLVRPGVSQCVVLIGDVDQSPLDRYLFSLQTLRISRTV